MCVFQFSEDHQTDPVNVLDAWKSNYTPPTWKPEVCVCVCVCVNTKSHLLYVYTVFPAAGFALAASNVTHKGYRISTILSSTVLWPVASTSYYMF